MNRQASKIWIYLNSLNIDMSDKTTVEQARKEYYRKYDRELKVRKRTIEKREFMISFPKIEIQHLRKRAKIHNASMPMYLKYLVKSDLLDVHILEVMPVYREILQLLQKYFNAIEEIELKESKRWFGNNDYEELRRILNSIKNEILLKKQ